MQALNIIANFNITNRKKFKQSEGWCMNKEILGVVISVKKQWWLKVNTKPIRMHALDGAVFPHIIKVKYTVNGTEYIKRKWIRAGHPVPEIGSSVRLSYSENNPEKVKLLQ